MRKLGTGSFAGMAVCFALLVGTGAPANGAPDDCDRAALEAAELVLQSSVAKVYEVVIAEDERDYYFCVRRVGDVERLNDSSDGSLVYGPPRMRLVGPLLAFVGETHPGEDPDTPLGTSVVVFDLRFRDSDRGRFVVADPGRDEYARVGSLVLRGNGAVAWISCPNTNLNRFKASPRGDCTRPGRFNSVYRVRSRSTRRELLARGRGIDPASLRLRGSTISWTRNGKTRRARLP